MPEIEIRENDEYGKDKFIKLATKEFDMDEEFTFKPIGVITQGKGEYGVWYLCKIEVDGEEVKTFTGEKAPIWRIMMANPDNEVTVKKVMRENKNTGNPYYTLQVVKGNKQKRNSGKEEHTLTPFKDIVEDDSDDGKIVLVNKETNEEFSEKEIIDHMQNEGVSDDKSAWVKMAEANNLSVEKMKKLYEQQH